MWKRSLLILLLWVGIASAQTGYFVRTDCASITTPVDDSIACLQTTTVSGRTAGHLYVRRSAAWVDIDTTGGAVAFSAITGATNTTAAMIVGTGASLSTSGSGTIAATTAAALAANPTNCAAGNYPLGIDAAGDVQSCTAAATGTVTNIATTAPIAGGPITGTGTITCNVASGSQPGCLSSADWTTFNNKQTSLTTGALSATAPIALSASRSVIGGAADISCAVASGSVAGCLSSTDWTTFNNKGSGTVTSVGLAGTSNQITVTGATPITTSGSWTLSIPTNPTLPGTTTGTFSGNLTGNVTGNASTATALAANPTNCTAGNYPLGIDASGNVESCTPAAGAGTVTLINTTAPIAGGPITTTGTVTCDVASGSQPGCLSSADWTTFNNKGSGTILGSIAATQVAFGSAANTITGHAGLIHTDTGGYALLSMTSTTGAILALGSAKTWTINVDNAAVTNPDFILRNETTTTIPLTIDGDTDNFTFWNNNEASHTWTFALSGATDPVLTFANNSVDVTTGNFSVQALTASRLVASDASKNLSSTITSANVASSVSDETGTAGKVVFDTDPTLTRPVISGTPAADGAHGYDATQHAANVYSSLTASVGTLAARDGSSSPA